MKQPAVGHICQQHSSSRSCSGVTSLETLERIRQCHLEMERVQMMTGCKLTLSTKVREKAKVKTNIREEIVRPTRALQTSTRGRIVAKHDNGRKTAGIAVEEACRNTGKGKSKNTGEGGKANTWTLSQLHACPISCPGQKIPLPDLGIHTASGARLQHDGGRLVTYNFQKDKQTEYFSTRVQCRNQFCLLAVSLDPDET